MQSTFSGDAVYSRSFFRNLKSVRAHNSITFSQNNSFVVCEEPTQLHKARPIVCVGARGFVVLWNASSFCIEEEKSLKVAHNSNNKVLQKDLELKFCYCKYLKKSRQKQDEGRRKGILYLSFYHYIEFFCTFAVLYYSFKPSVLCHLYSLLVLVL